MKSTSQVRLKRATLGKFLDQSAFSKGAVPQKSLEFFRIPDRIPGKSASLLFKQCSHGGIPDTRFGAYIIHWWRNPNKFRVSPGDWRIPVRNPGSSESSIGIPPCEIAKWMEGETAHAPLKSRNLASFQHFPTARATSGWPQRWICICATRARRTNAALRACSAHGRMQVACGPMAPSVYVSENFWNLFLKIIFSSEMTQFPPEDRFLNSRTVVLLRGELHPDGTLPPAPPEAMLGRPTMLPREAHLCNAQNRAQGGETVRGEFRKNPELAREALKRGATLLRGGGGLSSPIYSRVITRIPMRMSENHNFR